jgi:crotonyl-CoA reductase
VSLSAADPTIARDAWLDAPGTTRAVHLRAEDMDMFGADADRDVRRSLRVGTVPLPELAPDEVLVAVMASSINYNTIWSAMFQPMPTFAFLRRLGRQGGYATRHDLPHHVIGSDASGIVVRTGAGVRHWAPGDFVVVSPNCPDDQDPPTHADSMMSPRQLVWGYETNFGGLAEHTVVRATQLLPKPAHLTWEEAASITLCAGTAYRMLIGAHGARIKLGDIALIWGATGGLGSIAVQLVKSSGGIPIGIVGSEEKAEAARRLGCDLVIGRSEIGMTSAGPGSLDEVQKVGKRLGGIIRREIGEDPHVVFDYVGRATFGVSVFVARRGGVVVTCGSSTGYEHTFDNRYLWMNLKNILGSHVANLQEMSECIRLFGLGTLVPVLSEVHPLDDVGAAARTVQENRHIGKVGVLCQAPSEGLGVTDWELRAKIGEQRLNPLRRIPS